MNRVRAVLLGLQGAGAEFLDALHTDDQYELLAVADPDHELLRRAADDLGVATYDDFRSAIVESSASGLDQLFVALPPAQSREYLCLAAGRRVAVHHQIPFAESCEQARSLVRTFSEAGCELTVSRTWHFEPAFTTLPDRITDVGRVYAAVAEVQTAPDGRFDDFATEGGLLLCDAYDQLDMLVVTLGLPEKVACLRGGTGDPRASRSHDAEAAAVVVMHFARDRIGTLIVRRLAPNSAWKVVLAGPAGEIELTPTAMTTRRREAGSGQVATVNSANRFAPEFAAMARGLRSQNAARGARARDHLPTLAVIDAAYLSAKTGQFEDPANFL